jgi:hypothetical protein
LTIALILPTKRLTDHNRFAGAQGEKRKMQTKNKLFAAIVTIILVVSTFTALVNIQPAAGYNAATQAAIDAGMKWDRTEDATSQRILMWERYKDKVPTYTYGVVTPNPAAVDTRVSLIIFNPMLPPGASPTNQSDVRYRYKVEITDPDGNKQFLNGGHEGDIYVSDSTGTTYAFFTPTKIGNYSVTIMFQELYFKWWSALSVQRYYTGTTFLASNRTYNLEVLQEVPPPTMITWYPLPEEYWSRPIDGQNDSWGAISSNWLNNAKDRNYGSVENRYQPEGIAPNSGHILWTKVTEDGGVVGGNQYFFEEGDSGEVFNAGHQYQTRFQTQIMMHGRLTYQEPISFSNTGGAWVTVDLNTGEEIWRNQTMSAAPSFGYYYAFDNMNQHGVVNPGYIFSNNFGTAIHPRYGTTMGISVTNVPSSDAEVIGNKGEVLRYVFVNRGTTANPEWWLYQWNSSRVFIDPIGSAMSPATGTLNGGITGSRWPTYDWNSSMTKSGGAQVFSNTPTPIAVVDDVLLVSNGTLTRGGSGSMAYVNAGEVTITGISLKEGEEGRVLYQKNYDETMADGTQNLFIRAGEGVFIFQRMPMLSFTAYDVRTGNKVWTTPDLADENPYGYYTWSSLMNVHGSSMAYGKFFATGYTGMVHCYDAKNGTLLWKQEAPTGSEFYKYYTLFIGTLADGKIFIGTHEHSADTPLLKGAKVRVYDVETGDEVWSMMSWAHPGTMAIADGTLVYWNNYDHQVYAVGKGPSSTTVNVKNNIVTEGSSVMITGTVLDISAGTKQGEREYRFANGVAAVSEESQSQWMEYVYMQKPRPANVTGVDVVLSVLDSNNNYYQIGTATSNSDGDYSYMWKPEVSGPYVVYAEFKGSESYYRSRASTAFGVDEAVVTPAPTETPPSIADQYFVPATVGILIAIIAVGALLALLLLKKRV